MTIKEIRDALIYGDIRQISVLSEYSESMVKKVLNPNPKGEVRNNKKIMDIATKLAKQRLAERKAFVAELRELESVKK